MIANWYDVLDVEPTADSEQIRDAWRDAIADLTPADRRFRLYNQAAEVLLDPERRAEYDAELAEQEAEAEPEPEPPPVTEPVRHGDSPELLPDEPARLVAGEPTRVRLGGVPTWLVAVLGVLAALSVALAAYLFSQPTEAAVEEATGSARAAAERAIVPVLSYDYRTLDQDQAAAQDLLTSDYRRDYDDLFEVIRDNAEPTKTVVDVEVIASSVVRAGEDRVEILLFVNRPTTNAENKEPVVYKDQVTVILERVDDDWLVDELKTSPISQ